MEILGSLLKMLGFLGGLIFTLVGLFMWLGIFRLSKVIPAKHVLNRQVGKGMLFSFGALLGNNLVGVYSGNWNGWLAFLIHALFIVIAIIGLRIFMSAMKEINWVAGQEGNHTIS